MKNRSITPALALDAVSDHFRVEFRPVAARRFAARCEAHPIEPQALRAMIREIDGLIPRMQFGLDNPNNGRPHHWYEVGKEYSRVLYLGLATAYFPNGFDFPRLDGQLKRLAGKYRADEYDFRCECTGVTVRFWWD